MGLIIQSVVSKTDMVSLPTVNIMELSDSRFRWQCREVEEEGDRSKVFLRELSYCTKLMNGS